MTCQTHTWWGKISCLLVAPTHVQGLWSPHWLRLSYMLFLKPIIVSSQRVYSYWLKLVEPIPGGGVGSILSNTHGLNAPKGNQATIGRRRETGCWEDNRSMSIIIGWSMVHADAPRWWQLYLTIKWDTQFPKPQSPSPSFPLLGPQENLCVNYNGHPWFSVSQIKQGGLERHRDLLKDTSHPWKDLNPNPCPFSPMGS